jgi:hypothetical protein
MSAKAPPYIYRFRSCERLLGESKELESQEIFFATASQLNDPGEGLVNFHWKGDQVIWMRLFQHFFMCFEYCMWLAIQGDKNITQEDILIGITEATHRATVVSGLHDELWEDFYIKSEISKYPAALDGINVNRNDLSFLLKVIQSQAIVSILRVYSKRKFISPLTDEQIEQVHGKVIFLAANQIDDQLFNPEESLYSQWLRDDANFSRKYLFGNKIPKVNQFLKIEFVEHYIDKLETLVYPSWCMASFVDNPNKLAMWSYYAAQHSGVCLKFRTSIKENVAALSLNGVAGAEDGNLSAKVRNHLLRRVDYRKNFHSIDFFCSMGQVPVSILDTFWYADGKGNFSKCREGILSTNDAWRPQHWQLYYSTASSKLDPWMHEDEYRIIVSQPKKECDQKYTYSFSDLEGIIFGIKTAHEHKMKILDIIRKKCAESGRRDFSIYQAYLDRNTGEFKTRNIFMRGL